MLPDEDSAQMIGYALGQISKRFDLCVLKIGIPSSAIVNSVSEIVVNEQTAKYQSVTFWPITAWDINGQVVECDEYVINDEGMDMFVLHWDSLSGYISFYKTKQRALDQISHNSRTDGVERYWANSGRLIKEVFWENKQVVKANGYFEEGYCHTFNYKDNAPLTHQTFLPSGHLLWENIYIDGKPHGIFKSWFDSGTGNFNIIESYYHGLRHGIISVYLEESENDRIPCWKIGLYVKNVRFHMRKYSLENKLVHYKIKCFKEVLNAVLDLYNPSSRRFAKYNENNSTDEIWKARIVRFYQLYILMTRCRNRILFIIVQSWLRMQNRRWNC